VRLTDDGVTLFDRAVGRMFRRAELREESAVLSGARAVNDKVRLLAKLGTALIKAKAGGADLDGAVAVAVGWEKLAASVAEAERLARPDKADLPALAARAWPVLHRLGPVFLDAFKLRAVPAAASTLRAVELLQDAYRSGGRAWPESLPVSFLRAAWRDAVLGATSAERRIWETATLLALRDRLRAGDIWVEGSRQWRAVEDQLIPPALFTAMRAAGPLPVAVPATAAEYLAERRALLDHRLSDVAAKAAADALEDVTIKDGDMKITPLKAVTPEAAEDLTARLYGMIPNARITSLLAEVHRWTGFANLFTHQQTDLRPMTRASCSPACWPRRPTSASVAWPMPARSPASASWPGPPDGTCAKTPIDRHSPCWSTSSTASHSPHCSGRPTYPARTARVSPPPDAARPWVPSMPITGARRQRCSTHMFLLGTRRTTRSPSRPPVRPPT
jgi:hypothetical protein